MMLLGRDFELIGGRTDWAGAKGVLGRLDRAAFYCNDVMVRLHRFVVSQTLATVG